MEGMYASSQYSLPIRLFTPGHDRGSIFSDDQDRVHFLELAEEVREQFRDRHGD